MKNSKMSEKLASPSSGQAKDLSLDSIACPPALKAQLAASLEGKGLPLLLVGEEGAGKSYVALRLAAAMPCHDRQPQKGACGLCPSCRMLESGDHLDLVQLEPAPDKTSIAVASVRSQVAASLQIYPQLSPLRVYLISAAKQDSLNEQGQNALLKPMEEHPDFVRFILLTEDDSRLLPTIVSRSHMIRLGRRDDQDIRTILAEAGIGGQLAELAISYADGLPGQALAMAADESFSQLRDQVFDLVTRLPRASRTDCLTKDLDVFRAHKGEIGLIFRILESLLRDLLLLQQGLPPTRLVNKDLAGSLVALLEGQPEADPARAAGLIRQTAQALSAHVNYDHALARLLLGLRAHLGGQVLSSELFRQEAGFL
ncbi:MAG: hypothetical protein GX849_03200 [Clostridiaceae bacterium]|nr:hypothetical protein [Clostridiaceae bacterium]